MQKWRLCPFSFGQGPHPASASLHCPEVGLGFPAPELLLLPPAEQKLIHLGAWAFRASPGETDRASLKGSAWLQTEPCWSLQQNDARLCSDLLGTFILGHKALWDDTVPLCVPAQHPQPLSSARGWGAEQTDAHTDLNCSSWASSKTQVVISGHWICYLLKSRNYSDQPERSIIFLPSFPLWKPSTGQLLPSPPRSITANTKSGEMFSFQPFVRWNWAGFSPFISSACERNSLEANA